MLEEQGNSRDLRAFNTLSPPFYFFLSSYWFHSFLMQNKYANKVGVISSDAPEMYKCHSLCHHLGLTDAFSSTRLNNPREESSLVYLGTDINMDQLVVAGGRTTLYKLVIGDPISMY